MINDRSRLTFYASVIYFLQTMCDVTANDVDRWIVKIQQDQEHHDQSQQQLDDFHQGQGLCLAVKANSPNENCDSTSYNVNVKNFQLNKSVRLQCLLPLTATLPELTKFIRKLLTKICDLVCIFVLLKNSN